MSDNDGSSQAEQVQNTFEPISYVPSNSPQESDSERQKSPFNAISVDVDLASQMFERMNMPPLTPENALDRDEETFVFPKYIKCNDYGVGGTCPFAVKQSAFHAPTRRCNMHSQDITGNKAIMATSSYSNPKIIVNDEDGDDAVDVVATKADTPIDEEIFVGTEDTTKQTTQIDSATNSPSEKKDLMTAEYSGKRVKFDAQANSPKRGRSRQRRANRHRDGGTACLCVCLPLQGRGPLNWLVDRLQRCLKRKTAQRQSIVWHPRRIRNVYVDARYYQTQGEYPILFIPSLAVPFSTDSYHLHPIPEYNPLNVTTECCEEDDAYGPYQTPNARRGIERNEAYWTQNGQFYEDYLPTYHYHPILSRQMPSAYNTNMGQYGEPRNYVAPIDIPSTSTAPPVEMGQCVQPHPINPTMIQPLRGMRAPTPRMDQYGQLRLINPPAYTTTMAPDMLPDSLHHHHHHHSKSTLNVHQELSSRCNKDIRTGVKIMRFHFLGAVEVAIEHLGWEKFIFIGHSMGCELGLFYNAIHPGKITKMIFFDAELTLRRLQVQDLAEYQAKFYDYYYDNYMKENYHVKTYTKPQAVQALIRARKLPEDKAAIIVSKSLIHVKDDQYKFSWGNRLKFPAPQNYPNTYYFALFRTIPPTILISATETLENRTKYSAGSLELIKMMETLKNFHHVVVEGNHDVHLIHPERVAPYVNDFLRKTTVSSKL